MSITGSSSIGSNIPKLMTQTKGVAPTGSDVMNSFIAAQSDLDSATTKASSAADKADTFLNRTFRKGHVKDLQGQRDALKNAQDQMSKILDVLTDTLEKAYSTLAS